MRNTKQSTSEITMVTAMRMAEEPQLINSIVNIPSIADSDINGIPILLY